jgi:hypothetical protein
MSDGPGSLNVAVTFYTPSAWKRLAAMPEARIEKSYTEFVRDFERAMRGAVASGVRVEKVVIDAADIDDMIEWCHRNGYEIDAKGRPAYSAVRAMGALDEPITDKTRPLQ